MRDLIFKLSQFVEQRSRINFRDRRAAYASEVLNCMRDQVWSRRGEPETNKADFYAHVKMMMGSAIEAEMMDAWLKAMSVVGVHLLGVQVPVGGSKPDWNGYLDALVAVKNGDGKTWKNLVLEVKCMFGFGADLFMRTFLPKDSHLAQVGLYLKDLDSKGVTNEGILVCVPVSDRSIGQLVFVYCRYDSASDVCTAYWAISSQGESKDLDMGVKVGTLESRMREVEAHLERGSTPKPEFQYKYPLTREFLKGCSDNELRAALKGEKVLGDWQVKYSRYKDKQLKEDGIDPGYTDEELAVIRQEYRRRHPRSKL